MSSTAVAVPLRGLDGGKRRLGGLPPGRRSALVAAMASRVLRAAAPLPVHVVTADERVAGWARARGAEALEDPGGGLDRAVAAATAALAARGFARVVVAHADLPLADDLGWLADPAWPEVVLVPDRRDDGTPVLSVPADAPFRFAYGPGSGRRHRAEAARLGLRCAVVRDPLLGWDADVPGDLDLPRGAERARMAAVSRRARARGSALPAER